MLCYVGEAVRVGNCGGSSSSNIGSREIVVVFSFEREDNCGRMVVEIVVVTEISKGVCERELFYTSSGSNGSSRNCGCFSFERQGNCTTKMLVVGIVVVTEICDGVCERERETILH